MDSKWLNVILLGLPMLFRFILDISRCRRDRKADREAEEMQEKMLKAVEDDNKNKIK
jgi:hypothetical protein